VVLVHLDIGIARRHRFHAFVPVRRLIMSLAPLPRGESRCLAGHCAGVVRPKSGDRIRFTGPDPTEPVQIEANMLSHPDDLKAAIAGVELFREIGNSAPLPPYAKPVWDHGGRAPLVGIG
jgi:hypothetical protein